MRWGGGGGCWEGYRPIGVGAGIPGEEGEGGNEEVGGLISCVKVHLRFTAFQVKIEEGIAMLHLVKCYVSTIGQLAHCSSMSTGH